MSHSIQFDDQTETIEEELCRENQEMVVLIHRQKQREQELIRQVRFEEGRREMYQQALFILCQEIATPIKAMQRLVNKSGENEQVVQRNDLCSGILQAMALMVNRFKSSSENFNARSISEQDPEPLQLVEILYSVLGVVKFEARGKGLEFHLSFDCDHDSVRTDYPEFLQQILFQVLRHMVKLSPQGRITLRLLPIKDDTQGFHTCIEFIHPEALRETTWMKPLLNPYLSEIDVPSEIERVHAVCQHARTNGFPFQMEHIVEDFSILRLSF